MIKTSARRFSLALILGATSLVAVGSAHADGVTGTDPCPKNMLCSTGSMAAPASSVHTGSSPVNTYAQVALVLLGAA